MKSAGGVRSQWRLEGYKQLGNAMEKGWQGSDAEYSTEGDHRFGGQILQAPHFKGPPHALQKGLGCRLKEIERALQQHAGVCHGSAETIKTAFQSGSGAGAAGCQTR